MIFAREPGPLDKVQMHVHKEPSLAKFVLLTVITQ